MREELAWCSWCNRSTERGALVVGPGRGGNRIFYACPPCREKYGLTPIGDRQAEVRR